MREHYESTCPFCEKVHTFYKAYTLEGIPYLTTSELKCSHYAKQRIDHTLNRYVVTYRLEHHDYFKERDEWAIDPKHSKYKK